MLPSLWRGINSLDKAVRSTLAGTCLPNSRAGKGMHSKFLQHVKKEKKR